MEKPRSIAGVIVSGTVQDLLDKAHHVYRDGYKDEGIPDLYEHYLGKPAGANFLLSSALDGTRTWVATSGVGIPYPGAGIAVAGSGAWATSITPAAGLLRYTGAAFSWDNTTYLSALPSHTHGNITNAGAIGSTTGLPIITTTSGVLTVGSFGTTAGTFCEGNDGRLAASIPTQITVANEGSDVENFLAFFTSATGNLAPKTNAGIKFNAATGELTVTSLYVTNGIGAGGEINAFSGSAPTDWWLSIPHAAPGVWGAVLPSGSGLDYLNGLGNWTTISGFSPTSHTHAWGDITSGVPTTFTPSSHTLEGHTATVTTGKFLKGTGTNTFGWADHGLVASDVGLGNVTNESKATMFTAPVFTTSFGFAAAKWRIVESGNDLLLSFNSVTKGKLENDGSMSFTGEVTAYATL